MGRVVRSNSWVLPQVPILTLWTTMDGVCCHESHPSSNHRGPKLSPASRPHDRSSPPPTQLVHDPSIPSHPNHHQPASPPSVPHPLLSPATKKNGSQPVAPNPRLCCSFVPVPREITTRHPRPSSSINPGPGLVAGTLPRHRRPSSPGPATRSALASLWASRGANQTPSVSTWEFANERDRVCVGGGGVGGGGKDPGRWCVAG